MEIQEVKKFLDANKDSEAVKSLLNEVVSANFSSFAETESGKKLVQPLLDRAVTKGIESFKAKTLPEKEQALRETLERQFEEKYNPPTNPLAKDVADIKAELEATKKRARMLEVEKAVAGKLPNPDFMEYIKLPSDPEEALAFVGSFNEKFNASLETQLQKELNVSTRTPESGRTVAGGSLTMEKINNMSREEMSRNYEAVQDFMAKNSK